MIDASTTGSTSWHVLTPKQALALLESSGTGLAENQAAHRIEQFGPNELQAAASVSGLAVLLRQFKNALIVILLIATVISAALGHQAEAIAIAAIIALAVLLGFVQEYRAERALENLRKIAAPTCVVIRNGKEKEIPAGEIVPGDIFLLRAGTRIPADARLIEAVNLRVDEAALTGESGAISKQIEALPESALPIGDRINMVFAGTLATYGRGRAVVVGTGMRTEFGQIAALLQRVEPGKTPLQQTLDQAGRSLAKAALVLVSVIAALGIARGESAHEVLIFAIALAVAVVPEALPAVVTISLAIGMQRMVKRNALVRHLPAVETLGSTSVICTDKTGTLTRDEMTVREIFVCGKLVEVTGAGYEAAGEFRIGGQPFAPFPSLELFLRAASLVNDAVISTGETSGSTFKGDPTEVALVVVAAKSGLNKQQMEAQQPRIHEIPFTSESKRMTTLHQTPSGLIAYSKGAPEVILDSCTSQLHEDQTKAALDESSRKAILDAARQMAGEALRVIAVAYRPAASIADAEQGMTFLGLAGMIDPPRPEAKEAIRICRLASIRPIMITGDHPVTAQAVARELELSPNIRVVTGPELDTLDDLEFSRICSNANVFARVSPTHKLRIVSALQDQGQVVAMTGDGVNDAPALKKADIGVAMGITGTDVSKEAAAVTLLDDNFASIVAAVEEGRALYQNIKKYLMFLISSNIGEILLILVAAMLNFPMPLTAVQILYINLATDGLPALALAVDPEEADLMRRRPRRHRASIFSRPILVLMISGGIWSAIVNLSLLRGVLQQTEDLDRAQTMTFCCLVLIELIKAYNFRSDRHSVFRQPFANRWLNLAVAAEILVLVLVVQSTIFHSALGTVPLAPREWIVVLLAAATIIPVLESLKWMARRHWFGELEEHNTLAVSG